MMANDDFLSDFEIVGSAVQIVISHVLLWA